jgi:hypothetical protein
MRERPTLRPHASFEVPLVSLPADVGTNNRSSRLAAELSVAGRIAQDLAQRGNAVSDVRPGSGGGAGFSCRLARDCEVTVHLGAERRQADIVVFYLLSWQTSSFLRQVFRGGVKSSVGCDQRWKDFCRTVNEVLVTALGSTSVVWRTEEEERREQPSS